MSHTWNRKVSLEGRKLNLNFKGRLGQVREAINLWVSMSIYMSIYGLNLWVSIVLWIKFMSTYEYLRIMFSIYEYLYVSMDGLSRFKPWPFSTSPTNP